ncbi:MAG: hypothetical protein AAGB01_10855 [Cyanobacteria bacterium P01_F01_bin.42]
MDDSQLLTQIVVQCWKDDSFTQSFLTSPKTVLAEFGIECRGSVKISVIEDSPNQKTFVIPRPSPRQRSLPKFLKAEKLLVLPEQVA